MEIIRIALADDEELFRKGIILMLEKAGGFDIVFEAISGRTLLDWLELQNGLPDIVLLDLKMPELSGVETAKIIKERFATLKVIVLSSYYSETYIHNMLQNGATAFLSKNSDTATMLHTIHEVHANGFFYSPDLLRYINSAFRTPHNRVNNLFDSALLTKREREILILICKQLTATEVAQMLYISPRTVEGHKNSLLMKTGSKNMISLVIYALEEGIVTLDEIKKRG